MSDDVSTADKLNKEKVVHSSEPSGRDDSRRRFFEIASIAIGAVVGIVPAIIGLFAFIDPLRRKPSKPELYRDGNGGIASDFIRVASLDALSLNAPQRFPVIDDQLDAWNFTPNQPIGAVYIERLGDAEVRVFNTTCPHAGCSVACNGTAFHCPCHNSSFNLDGSKLVSTSGRENPSPRDLDSLEHEIRNGDIWVKFQNFYTGKHEKKAKA